MKSNSVLVLIQARGNFSCRFESYNCLDKIAKLINNLNRDNENHLLLAVTVDGVFWQIKIAPQHSGCNTFVKHGRCVQDGVWGIRAQEGNCLWCEEHCPAGMRGKLMEVSE